ncbi:MAG TPA: hypothetical protein VFA53_00125 [Xanthobacteraceae bacterium]|nr:hypothetical protein [Xanthobacteraceae bacterium]
MTAPTLPLPRAAALLEAQGESELAAELLALHRGDKSDDGDTLHNLTLARLWCAIQDRISAGEDEGDVLADEADKNQMSADRLDNLWAVQGCPAVRAILKRWGRI